jgi:signal transduction histidine kinase
MLVVFALMLQHIYGGFLASGRFNARLLRFARLYPRHVHSCAGSVAERDGRSLWPPGTLKRAARTRTANKLLNLEVVLASIVHEISQPLGAVSLNSETAIILLDKTPFDSEKVRNTLSLIGEDCTRITSTVRGMRALFKREASGSLACNPNHAINEALALEGHELSGRGIQVEKALDESIPLLRMDAHQLQQVLLNLIANAIDAMRPVVDPQPDLAGLLRSEGLARYPGGARHRHWNCPRGHGKNLRADVHDQRRRHGDGPMDLSRDRGILRRPVEDPVPYQRGVDLSVELPIDTVTQHR